MKIPVFYAFPRSGGTLVNRCLGCIPGNLILSEINPFTSVVSVEYQALNWLKLITEDELEEFSEKSYSQKISDLVNRSQEKGNVLIIRDWPAINFFDKLLEGEPLIPSCVLEQDFYLQTHGFDCLSVVISRRAADVYESMMRTFQHLTISADEFGIAYYQYAQLVSNYPVFHYEQLCQNPVKIIKEICDALEINYDPSFLNNFHHFTACTGDNKLSKPSRGIQLQVITSLPTIKESENYIAASLDPYCQKADKLLNYCN